MPWPIHYGNNVINGRDVAVVPGSTVTLGNRTNVVEVRSAQLWYYGEAFQTFLGGTGRDIFEGGAGTFYGGDGDDLFQLSGEVMFPRVEGAPIPQVIAYGGAGNDHFVTPRDISSFFGGSGSDGWTNIVGRIPQGTLRATADLGAGNDLAHFMFTTLSGPEGEVLLDQRAELDGGRGHDRLIIQHPWQGTGPGARNFDLTAENGTWTVFSNLRFRNFESYTLLFGGADEADRVVFGAGDDYLNMGAFRDRLETIEIFGGAGHDTLLGAMQLGDEYIFGGAGHDVILGGGGWTGHRDFIFGRRGDDVLFSNGISAGNTGVTTLRGGEGRDIFSADGYATGTTTTRIADFVQGEDRFAFNMTFGLIHAGLRDDVPGTAHVLQGVAILRDTARFLDFTFTFINDFGRPDPHRAVYDRASGWLWSHYRTDEAWSWRNNATSDWIRIARFADSPDLQLSDFLVFDYV